MDAKLTDVSPELTASPPPTRGQPPLRASTIASFSLGSVASSCAAIMLAGGHLTYYLNQVLGLDPLLVGVGVLASLTIDAVMDPLIGQWSDNLRSRMGRRHPFMYAAAILSPLTYLLLWHTPHIPASAGLIVYIFLCLAAARIATSTYELTSGSLIPELAPGYNQRTWLLSFRALVAVVSAMTLALLLNLVFLRRDAQHPLGLLNRSGYENFSVLCAVVVGIGALVSAVGTQSRVRYLATPPARRSTAAVSLRQMAILFSNRSLMVVLTAGLLSGVVGGATSGMQLYMYTYFWGLDPQQFAVFAPIGTLVSMVAIFGAPLLSTRFGKKPTMLAALTVALFTTWVPIVLKLLGLMPAEIGWVIFILAIDIAITATLTIMGTILVGSMVADVVEDNAVKTGRRVEGLLFAANGLMPKIAGGLGMLLSGAMLAAVHFPTHAAKGAVPAEAMRHLVLIYMPVAAALSLLSIAALSFFRIDRATHERNLSRLTDMGLTIAVIEPVDEVPSDASRTSA